MDAGADGWFSRPVRGRIAGCGWGGPVVALADSLHHRLISHAPPGRATRQKDRTQAGRFGARPASFVLENVKNLKSHDGGRTFNIIHRTLTEAPG